MDSDPGLMPQHEHTVKRASIWIAAGCTALVIGVSAVMLVRSLQGDSEAAFFVFPALMSCALGTLIVVRRVDNHIGPLLIGVGVSATLLGAVDLVTSGSFDPATRGLAGALADGFFVVTFVQIFVLLPLWFPTGHATSGYWTWVARVGIGLAVVTAAAALLSSRLCIEHPPGGGECLVSIENPMGFAFVPSDLADLTFLPLMLSGLFGLAGLVARYRRSRGIERQQMKWLVMAVAFLVAVFALSVEPVRIASGLNNTVLMDVLLVLGYSSIPTACTVAVLRYRLYEIERIISRTITYALVVGALGTLFAVAVTAVTTLLPTQDTLAVAGSTLLMASAFNPLRRRVQGWVDRRFNRSRYDAEQIMREFTDRLHENVGDAPVLDDLLAVVYHALQPSSAAVWVPMRMSGPNPTSRYVQSGDPAPAGGPFGR